MLMIRPQPRSLMPSITWRVTLNTLFRLVLITAIQSCSVMRLNTESRVMPALLTQEPPGTAHRGDGVKPPRAGFEVGDVALGGVHAEARAAHRVEPFVL